MSVKVRNNVKVSGNGPATMLFAHGFGCDQSMWRFLSPAFAERFRIVTFDLVGSGGSDLDVYDRQKYGTLDGYADDMLDIVAEFCSEPVIIVGHSVSAIIGMLAAIKSPHQIAAQILVSPSPSYINDGEYVGGFSREDIDDLLDTMDGNYLGWSSSMAPVIMGAPEQPVLREELVNSFCQNDPAIARHFAKVTFLSDYRKALCQSVVPALILQCSDDLIAPQEVGRYMQAHMRNSALHMIENIGHCPHMSAPTASSAAIEAFVASYLV
ncbi:MAG: alpha/beta fold hydrolase [Janthinobacterium lividum]